MHKVNKIATKINATHGLSEMEQQVREFEQSNLPEEEKNRTLKFHNKMIKTTNFVFFKLVVFLLYKKTYQQNC